MPAGKIVKEFVATAAEWTAKDEILEANYVGRESDTGKIKRGDGATKWSSLTYTSTNTALTTPTITGGTITSPTISSPIITAPSGASSTGLMITKMCTFTENATSTTHTGTIAIPAGAWLHNIQVVSSVLWTGGTASMKVGDTADDDGYFVGIDLKATDLLVGEVLDTSPSTSWGGKEGAYLVAASGRRGPTSSNFAKYYAAGSNITGIVTVGTPATTAGRTFMAVTYSVGEVIAAVAN